MHTCACVEARGVRLYHSLPLFLRDKLNQLYSLGQPSSSTPAFMSASPLAFWLCTATPHLCRARNGTQGFVHAKQAHYQLSHTSNLLASEPKNNNKSSKRRF